MTDHLARVEAEIGVALLLRRPRSVTLLPPGHALLPIARTLIETSAHAREAVTRTGLALAASSNAGVYLLAPAIAAFERETATTVALWVGPNPAVRARLLSGQASAAVMEWWEPEPGFEARPWRDEALVLITPPGHPLARRGRAGLADLEGETLLAGEPGSGTGRVLRAGLCPLADRLRLRGGFNSAEAVKRAVRAGLGVSLVLASAVRDELEAGTLVAPVLGDAELAKTLWLVLPAEAPPGSPAARLARILEART